MASVRAISGMQFGQSPRKTSPDLPRDVQTVLAKFRQEVLQPTLDTVLSEHRQLLSSEFAELRKQVRQDVAEELGARAGTSVRRRSKRMSTATIQDNNLADDGDEPHQMFNRIYKGALHQMVNENLPTSLRGFASQHNGEPRGDENFATDDDESMGLMPGHVELVQRSVAKRKTVFRNRVGVCGFILRGLSATHRFLLQVANHPALDLLAAIVILVNAVVLGLETDFQAKNAGHNNAVFNAIDKAFCAFFTMELMLRFYAQGLDAFNADNIAWTLFDTLVVGCQLIDETLQSMTTSAKLSNVSILRIMRIFRLLRVLRLVRILHLVVELRTMLASILGSMKALFWVVVLYSLLVFVAGCFFTQVVTEQVNNKQTAVAVVEKLEYYYGDLGTSILSLWECISGGEDWRDMFDPLFHGVSPLAAGVFLMYVVFATIAMMNVVTGVFVEHANRYADRDQDLYLAKNVIGIFSKSDLNEEGEITMTAWEEKMDAPELQALFKELNVDTADARLLFKLIDHDDSGSLALDELIDGWVRLRGPAKSLDLALLMRESDHANRATQRSLRAIEETVFALSDNLLTASQRNTPLSSPRLSQPPQLELADRQMLSDTAGDRGSKRSLRGSRASSMTAEDVGGGIGMKPLRRSHAYKTKLRGISFT